MLHCSECHAIGLSFLVCNKHQAPRPASPQLLQLLYRQGFLPPYITAAAAAPAAAQAWRDKCCQHAPTPTAHAWHLTSCLRMSH